MCHAPYVALWDTRAGRIITARLMVGIMDFHDPYIQWYRRITRRFMTPPLHKNDMRYHGPYYSRYYSDFGKLESCDSKVFFKFE